MQHAVSLQAGHCCPPQAYSGGPHGGPLHAAAGPSSVHHQTDLSAAAKAFSEVSLQDPFLKLYAALLESILIR